MKHFRQGFSLIEVLLFITILRLIFIAAAGVGIVSIRNSQNSLNKIRATHYAEEAINWLSSQKNADWLIFIANASPPPGAVYCFNIEPVSAWPSGAGNCVSNQLIDSLFTREVILTYDSVLDSVDVDIQVTWSEGGNNYSVPISSTLRSFE